MRLAVLALVAALLPAAADRAFFAALFDRCDTVALGSMVTEDFEMFHDKGGRTATSGAQFVKAIEGMCARQRTGEDYRARRESYDHKLSN